MNKRRFSVRNRKRQLLQLTIMLASPVVTCHLTSDVCFADSPTETTQRILPAAPVSRPQVNPFCQPVPTDSAAAPTSIPQFGFVLPNQSTVQLTSTHDEVAKSDAKPDALVQPVQVAPKRNAWKAPVDTSIQPKPIHTNRDSLTLGSAVDHDNETPVVDGAVSFNPAHPVPAVPQAVQGKSATAAAAPKMKDEGAVAFSLNDETLVETSVEAAKPNPTKPVTATGKHAASDKPSMGPMLSHGTSELVPPVVVSKSNSIPVLPASTLIPSRGASSSHAIKTNRFANDSEVVVDRGSGRVKTHLVPMVEPETVQPVAITQAAPDRRIVRGGRPAVDVGRPPVMIERNTSVNGTLVASAAELNPAKASKYAFDKAFESDDVVVLDLKCTEVRALKLDHAISKVQVGDSTVCAALAAGPSQVQLIGASDGVTRLAIWTSNSVGQETKSVYEIRVGQSDQTGANSPQSVANQLTKTVQAAFPESKLVVRAQDDQLIVEGVCSNDESAKKAIRMIRSACLMPVVDKVVIR